MNSLKPITESPFFRDPISMGRRTKKKTEGKYPEMTIKRAAMTRRLVKPLCALLVDLQKRQENYSIGNLAQHVGGNDAARKPRWTQIAKMANR